MEKVIIISLIFTTLGLFSLQNCLAVNGNYSFAGVQISAMNYDGIKATISYANPNLVSNNDFSGENISLADNNGSWVEVGWMKDPNKGAYSPMAFLENMVVNDTIIFYSLTPTTHTYELVFVGRRTDNSAVFRFYLDGNLMYGTGIMAPQDLWPQAKGEVYNTTASYSDMGPASISNIQLRYAGSYVFWKDQYPTLNTTTFAYLPYQLFIFDKYYNIGNKKQ
ncbi:hypothetical protein CSE_00820 [Caldisericum exile AZM16c01]|uniref:Uncharacterized protein n=1 Tax=Caldisericum exile (strain DSM 21853 / NBRC 104410 / AZM16c01) TaxID=511051 RepID=A0A7U6JE94_CALEA|nr:hypothetical protein CSE_00820 [Caldisericum exile AZM16c01]